MPNNDGDAIWVQGSSRRISGLVGRNAPTTRAETAETTTSNFIYGIERLTRDDINYGNYERIPYASAQSLIADRLVSSRDIKLNAAGEYYINREKLRIALEERQRRAYARAMASMEMDLDGVLMSEALVTDGEAEEEGQLFEESCDDSSYDDEEEYQEPRWKTLTSVDLPAYEIPLWESAEQREDVSDLYFKQVDYRLKWIFYREEKEGFRRRSYGVMPFCRQDFLDKVAKKGEPHPLNTDDSTFYDWNIGATDFILRFENFEVEEVDCMRIHFIHKGTNKEICFQDRVWDGQFYQSISQQWAEIN